MYFAHNIQMWHVYMCPNCNFSTPPKDKWVVVVGMADKNRVYGFFINTEIAFFIRDNEDFLKLQIAILHSEHQFLKYDSYVNTKEFHHLYASDLRNKQKEVSSDTKQRIRDAVLASPLFSDAEKARLAP